MPKVSVIMPSLNVAAYIRECLDSVVCQTLKDIEIICVDAGSTDGTWEILTEYAQTDSRIKLLQSAKKSYGCQMNMGLRAAAGEYIGIVETDDYILPEMYEELYAFGVEHDADFVKSDFDVFTTPSRGDRLFLRYSLNVNSSVKYNVLFTSEDYIRSKRTIDVFVWNGIYKRQFLSDHDIWFQETPGAAFQDCGFRYQVALNLERGFFLERSFYRYRRDNAGASTYNSKCVLFNLAECKNLLEIARKKGWMDHKPQAQFLAREMAVIAHRPYAELLTYGEPAVGTADALEKFRAIFKGFAERDILNQASAPEGDWLELRMLMEHPEVYDYYMRLKAEISREAISSVLRDFAGKGAVILFGSGQIGAYAYCTIRNSGLRNVVAFCDNAAGKWGTTYMGCPVKSPEEAVRQYPEAYIVLTVSGARQDDIRAQLLGLGVPAERITAYNLNTDPMFSTNVSLQRLIPSV